MHFSLIAFFTGFVSTTISNAPPVFTFDSYQGSASNNPGIPNFWGASCINITTAAGPEFICVGSGFTQAFAQPAAPTDYSYSSGLFEWPEASVCRAVRSKTGDAPYELIGDLPVGNYVAANAKAVNPNNVFWGHNCAISIICIPAHAVSGKKECALRIDFITQTLIKTGQLQLAFYGIPSVTTSSSYVSPFPKTKANQGMFVAYHNLTSTAGPQLNQEISTLFKSTQTVVGVNGFNQTTTVLKGFSLLDVSTKVPNPFINSVNPRPLIDATNNQNAFIQYNGQIFTITVYRIVKNSLECLAFLVGPGSQFIWEAGAEFYKGHTLCYATPKQPKHHIEDPFCWKDKFSIVYCLAHDFVACGGSANKQVCGSLMVFRSNATNLANPSQAMAQYWSTPVAAYNANGLNETVIARQRPWVYFDENGEPAVLRTGVVAKGKFVRAGKQLLWQGPVVTNIPVKISAFAPPVTNVGRRLDLHP